MWRRTSVDTREVTVAMLEDVDAWAADLEARGAEDDYLFSINRYCFLGVAE